MDIWNLYREMLKSRLFEQAIAQLWQEGRISGEMHLGVGEEAIVAGVVDHLRPGDAMALDHRGTPPLLMRGVDPVLLIRELLGRRDGLCKGMGGHMHLFSRPHLSASSGIVGASGPAAAGFALAAQHLRPEAIAVAFFGEGALNEGMMLEALNLAAAWQLPVLFVCKDNDMAITTSSTEVTGGKLVARAKSFGLATLEVDGSDVQAVWRAARNATARARQGQGPTFLHAHCIHLEGHFLGDPLVQMTRNPLKNLWSRAGPLLKSLAKRQGAPLGERIRSLRTINRTLQKTRQELLARHADPIRRTRQELEADAPRLKALEQEVEAETAEILSVATALAEQERSET
jgi:pyruvate dehydrogenase E1 component alpha subunit